MQPNTKSAHKFPETIPFSVSLGDVDARMKDFEAVLDRRVRRNKSIGKERRKKLLADYSFILANPDSLEAATRLRNLLNKGFYRGVAIDKKGFCKRFLGLSHADVDWLIHLATNGIASGRTPPAEPVTATPDHPAPSADITVDTVTDQSHAGVVAAELDIRELPLFADQHPSEPAQPTEAPLVPLEVITENMPAFWASKINSHICSSVTSLVNAGRDLLEAKSKLLHGQFASLFESGLLRVSQRTAQKLMEVAANPALANANNCSFLPPALNSLIALAKIEEKTLQKAIDEKQISPRMTIGETRSLVSGLLGNKVSSQEPMTSAAKPSTDVQSLEDYGPTDHAAGFSRITQALDEEFKRCPTQTWKTKLVNRVTEYLGNMKASKWQ